MHMLGMLIVSAFIIFMTGWADDFDEGYKAARQGQVDAAIYHYTQALQSNDLSRRNQARALNNRAIAYYQKGMFTRALTDLDLAIQLSPDELDITRNRQTTYLASNGTMQASFQSAAVSDFPGGLRLQQRIKLFGLL